MNEFHANLKEAMKIKNITTKILADKTGLKEGTISNYLKTNGSIPNIENGLKLAEALGVSVKFLVTGFEYSESETLNKSTLTDYQRSLRTANNLQYLPEDQRSALETIISEIASKYHSSKS